MKIKAYFCEKCGQEGYKLKGDLPDTCQFCGPKGRITKLSMSGRWLKNHMDEIRACGLSIAVTMYQTFGE